MVGAFAASLARRKASGAIPEAANVCSFQECPFDHPAILEPLVGFLLLAREIGDFETIIHLCSFRHSRGCARRLRVHPSVNAARKSACAAVLFYLEAGRIGPLNCPS